MKVNSAIWNGNKVFKVYESEPMVNSLARKKLSQVKCFKQTRIVPVTFEIYASFLYMSLSPMYVVCFFRETIKWYVFPPQGHAPHSGTKEESWHLFFFRLDRSGTVTIWDIRGDAVIGDPLPLQAWTLIGWFSAWPLGGEQLLGNHK